MTISMPLILDAISVGIIIIFAVASFKGGFLNTVVRLAGTVGAIVVSMIYSKPVAQGVYTSYFHERILAAVARNVNEMGSPGIEAFSEGVRQFVEDLPPMISKLISPQLEGSMQQLYEQFSTLDTSNFAAAITKSMVEPMAMAMIQAAVFCLMFGLIMILVRVLAGLLKGVNYVPVIGTVNEILGAVLGALQGMAYLFMIATTLWLIMAATGDTLSFINYGIIQDTMVFRHFFSAASWISEVFRGL